MSKNRLENLPRQSTIARHFAEGKYVDYPADIILSAVNSQDNEYNPTAIPIKLGFKHYLHGNNEAFLFLIEHNAQSEIDTFLDNPNRYMADAGISLVLPFDEISPKIFAALVEDEIVDVLKNPDMEAVFKIVRRQNGSKWPSRHPERYPKEYMCRELPYGLQDIPYSIREIFSVENGFSEHFNLCMLVLSHYFCGEYDDFPIV
ncbi:MAG: hypothetical protein NC453_15425 [Muribaculum sp.]|nr:hypothetical protein [Muribaculum sp.]